MQRAGEGDQHPPIKALLRREAMRTRDALWVGDLFAAFSPDECRNSLNPNGYAFD
jgi:hypothetical protein